MSDVSDVEDIKPSKASRRRDNDDDDDGEHAKKKYKKEKEKKKSKSKKEKVKAESSDDDVSESDAEDAHKMVVKVDPPAPVVAAAAAPVSSVGPDATKLLSYTSKSPYVLELADVAGAGGDLISTMLTIAKSPAMDALVKRGAVHVDNPDVAMFVESIVRKRHIHCFELDKPEMIMVTRSKPPKNGSSTKTYLNLKTKFNQYGPDGVQLKGFNVQTPWVKASFLRIGPTEKTGVNGTLGKIILGALTTPDKATYAFSATNRYILEGVQNEDYNNPLADRAFELYNKITRGVLETVCAQQSALPEMRQKMHEYFNKPAIRAQGLQVPTNPKDVADWLIDNDKYKCRLGSTKGDPTGKELGMSASVHRTLGRIWGNEPGSFTLEDISNYVPPSAMFEACRVNYQGHPTVHNPIPMFRCRRADEIVEGEIYSSPYIPIPFENAMVTARDVISVGYSMGFYENQFERAGMTNKPQYIIWLNTADELLRMEKAGEIKPCDPRYAIPGAGHYEGPLDRAAKGVAEPEPDVEYADDGDNGFAAFVAE